MAFLERLPQKSSVKHIALLVLPFLNFFFLLERVFLPHFSHIHRVLEAFGCRPHGRLFNVGVSPPQARPRALHKQNPPLLFTARRRGLCGAGGPPPPP